MSAGTTSENRDTLSALLERMVLIRKAEERLSKAAQAGELPGAVHLYIGQEASGVGACSQLKDSDWITSTHRGHGHFLAKGGDINAMYAEIWGKRQGICKGMGGSMHVADVSKGILGANGIVGGGFAIATGAAYGAKLRDDGRVSMCFFGDGAANQGVFMETMNVSSVWKLPMVFLCENNRLSEFTVSSTITAGNLVDRAKAFMPTIVVDGNDVLAVREAVGEAVARARGGEGPTYVETGTYRIHGHLEAEDAFLAGGKYRSKEEIEAWQTKERDPISRFETYLTSNGIMDEAAIAAIHARVQQQVDDAVKFAEAGDDADPKLSYTLMFADQEA
ncbi:MAG: thiamine pyrophosphate-dependent dehydrogenase E1 component subunit alpha [Gammaproteobacteria bacterium]|nr:thiamine pyrophosphate-dependent dehydrogenase E1 component subunit alpha [Gammaproteobacteria bacterium]MCP5146422.1 thiamine pyrophosphate-dependent dehydrogenase E1 component subunit alpha [Gammaproteobacteria bacterium]